MNVDRSGQPPAHCVSQCCMVRIAQRRTSMRYGRIPPRLRTHRPQRPPATRPTLFQREPVSTWVRQVHRPSPVSSSRPADHVDRVGEALVTLGSAVTEMLQSSHDVEVPLRREREPGDRLIDDLPGACGWPHSSSRRRRVAGSATTRRSDRVEHPHGRMPLRHRREGSPCVSHSMTIASPSWSTARS